MTENSKEMPKENNQFLQDPRILFAAERTFLAWIRTGLASMGLGFVVARFGLFLREMASANHVPPSHHSGFSLYIGITLVALGIMINMVSAYYHHDYLQRLKRGESTPLFSHFNILVALVLALLGMVLTTYLLLL